MNGIEASPQTSALSRVGPPDRTAWRSRPVSHRPPACTSTGHRRCAARPPASTLERPTSRHSACLRTSVLTRKFVSHIARGIFVEGKARRRVISSIWRGGATLAAAKRAAEIDSELLCQDTRLEFRQNLSDERQPHAGPAEFCGTPLPSGFAETPRVPAVPVWGAGIARERRCQDGHGHGHGHGHA